MQWQPHLYSCEIISFSKQEDNWGHYGARFATFICESEPTEFLKDFEKERSENVSKHIDKALSEARIKIPEKYIPDMSKDYYWKYIFFHILICIAQ